MGNIGKRERVLKSIFEVLQETPLTALRQKLSDGMVLQACADAGYEFRRRKYGPICIASHFLLQAIQREESFAATWQEIAANAAGQMGLDELSFNSSAISQARSRFPKAAFDSLVKMFCAVNKSRFDKWRGMRLLALDSTTVSMPAEDALFEHFGRHKARSRKVRYPLGTFSALLSVGTSLILDYHFGPYDPGEVTSGADLLEAVAEGDLILADRHFAGSPTLGRIIERRADLLMRKNARLVVRNLPVIKRLGKNDFITEIAMDRAARRRDPSLPGKVRVRLCKGRWRSPEGRRLQEWFVTSLMDNKRFKGSALARCYHERWRIETSFREFKVLFHADVLRSKTVENVEKEFRAHVLAYQLLRLLIVEAADKHHKKPREISFLHAARWVIAFSSRMSVAPPAQLTRMYEHLIEAIASTGVTPRPGRIEPRAIMREKMHYPRSKISRLEWLEKRLKRVA